MNSIKERWLEMDWEAWNKGPSITYDSDNVQPERKPIVRTTWSGKPINLLNFKPEDVDIEDIARALAHTNRFNGHTREPFSVAEHCILMSYMADNEYKLEALLHDAGEAYVGDLAPDIKALFPDLAAIEDRITGTIFSVLHKKYCHPEYPGSYTKSKYVHNLDSLVASIEGRYLRPHLHKNAKTNNEMGRSEPLWGLIKYYYDINTGDTAQAYIDRYNTLRGILDNA